MIDKETYKSNKIKEYYKNKAKKQYINKYSRDKRIKEIKEDSFGPIYHSIISRINKTLKKNNIDFKNTYQEIIGCNKNDLKNFIINKLKINMNIDNYGLWEIDHIIPVSYFNFTDYNNIFKCFHYTNLQPLWKQDNMIKSNKIY